MLVLLSGLHICAMAEVYSAGFVKILRNDESTILVRVRMTFF